MQIFNMAVIYYGSKPIKIDLVLPPQEQGETTQTLDQGAFIIRCEIATESEKIAYYEARKRWDLLQLKNASYAQILPSEIMIIGSAGEVPDEVENVLS